MRVRFAVGRPARRLFAFGEYPLVGLEIGGAVEDEPDQAHVFQTVSLFPYRPERHPRRLLDRVAEDPGGDGGEGDGFHAVLLGERERVAVAAPQELSLRAVLAVDRPQSVDDVMVRKSVRASYDGLAGFYWAERHSFLGQPRS